MCKIIFATKPDSDRVNHHIFIVIVVRRAVVEYLLLVLSIHYQDCQRSHKHTSKIYKDFRVPLGRKIEINESVRHEELFSISLHHLITASLDKMETRCFWKIVTNGSVPPCFRMEIDPDSVG